uniref:Uncharacterized protein n=1 Tax=Timema tahoe TaxID=61484 RepID=A0A7R9ISP8_9NEOP|nr:unnamed protein product [Timema tahoe]
MPRKNLCCVPQCEYVPGTVRHKFPVLEERFSESLNVLGLESGPSNESTSLEALPAHEELTNRGQIPGFEKDFTTSTGDCNNPTMSGGVLCSLENNPQHKQAVTVSSHHLAPAAEDTADLLLFMDHLFDSVNGSSAVPIKGNNLRCAVTIKSDHEEFRETAFKVLYELCFGGSQAVTERVCDLVPSPKQCALKIFTNFEPPSIGGWAHQTPPKVLTGYGLDYKSEN